MNFMNPTLIKHNLSGILPKEKELLDIRSNHFARWVNLSRKIEEWKKDACTRSTYVSQKHKSLTRALNEFKDLYQVKSYFAMFGKNDDSFKIYYRKD